MALDEIADAMDFSVKIGSAEIDEFVARDRIGRSGEKLKPFGVRMTGELVGID